MIWVFAQLYQNPFRQVTPLGCHFDLTRSEKTDLFINEWGHGLNVALKRKSIYLYDCLENLTQINFPAECCLNTFFPHRDDLRLSPLLNPCLTDAIFYQAPTITESGLFIPTKAAHCSYAEKNWLPGAGAHWTCAGGSTQPLDVCSRWTFLIH